MAQLLPNGTATAGSVGEGGIGGAGGNSAAALNPGQPLCSPKELLLLMPEGASSTQLCSPKLEELAAPEAS